MSNRQAIGLIGAVMLGLGVFCPLVSVPIVGSISYFANGKGDGVLVLAAAAVAFVMVLRKQLKPAATVAGAALCLIAFVVYQFHTKMSEVRASMKADLADNPFRGIAEGLVQTVQLQWGLGVMVIGALLLIAAGLVHDEAASPAAPPIPAPPPPTVQ